MNVLDRADNGADGAACGRSLNYTEVALSLRERRRRVTLDVVLTGRAGHTDAAVAVSESFRWRRGVWSRPVCGVMG